MKKTSELFSREVYSDAVRADRYQALYDHAVALESSLRTSGERKAMSDADKIVGHKTFSTGDPLNPFRHEPLTEAEADAMFAAANAAEKKRAEDMPTEQDAVSALWSAYQRLRELGWKEACYAPTAKRLLLVEPGSSGIHRGHADGDWPNKSFWITEAGDLWPSRPCLFKMEGEPPAAQEGK